MWNNLMKLLEIVFHFCSLKILKNEIFRIVPIYKKELLYCTYNTARYLILLCAFA